MRCVLIFAFLRSGWQFPHPAPQELARRGVFAQADGAPVSVAGFFRSEEFSQQRRPGRPVGLVNLQGAGRKSIEHGKPGRRALGARKGDGVAMRAPSAGVCWLSAA